VVARARALIKSDTGTAFDPACAAALFAVIGHDAAADIAA
jgi:hypothetical protein